MKIKVKALEWSNICCGCRIKINPHENTYMLSDITGIDGSVHFCKNCMQSLNAFYDMAENINEDLFNTVNDVLVNLKNLKVAPSNDEIKKVIKVIPEHILSIGREWGYNDTVFSDKLYQYLKEINY